jgi:hypothetical protein
MEAELSFFTDFCGLIDFKQMKTVNDDTVSDPKPRPKKVPNPEIQEKEESSGKKEYKLEKAKKPKDGYRKLRDELEEPKKKKEIERGEKSDRFEKKKYDKGQNNSERFERKKYDRVQNSSERFERKKYDKGQNNSERFEKKKERFDRKKKIDIRPNFTKGKRKFEKGPEKGGSKQTKFKPNRKH